MPTSSVCQVDLGPAGGVKTIVCGAQNYQVGDRVPVALPGAVLPGDFVIKLSKIRGQSSDGMMCSAKELGVAEDASGLLILAGRPALGTPINEVLPPAAGFPSPPHPRGHTPRRGPRPRRYPDDTWRL